MHWSLLQNAKLFVTKENEIFAWLEQLLMAYQRKIPINTNLRYLREKAAWVNQMLHESKKESLKANASV